MCVIPFTSVRIISDYFQWVKLQREMMIFTVHGIHEDLTKNVLAFRPIGTNDMIEAVLNVQGYLVETDLPPLLQKQKCALTWKIFKILICIPESLPGLV